MRRELNGWGVTESDFLAFIYVSISNNQGKLVLGSSSQSIYVCFAPF